MILEIVISAIITVLLVFIGCLVLGLEISSLKSSLSNEIKTQQNLSRSLTTMEANYNSNVASISNDNKSIRSTVFSQGVDLYNAQQGMRKMVNVQQEQGKALLGAQKMSTSLGSNLDMTSANLRDLRDGTTGFSTVKVGTGASLAPTRGGGMALTGSEFVIGSSNTLFEPGACIQMGQNRICNMGADLNITGNLATSNMRIGNLGLTTQEGMLKLQDENGLSRGVILNGIKQTMPGSMIDYNGYGIGEYENSVIRTYAPANAGSKISMSFKKPDATFVDVVSVKGDGVVSVQGDLNISGSINNTQIQNAIAQSQQALSIAKATLLTLQESKLQK